MGRKPIDRLPQPELTRELREAIDAARITDPIRGPNPSAKRKVRRLIDENPTSVRSFYVQYNLGKHRWEWLSALLEQDTLAVAIER